MTIRLSVIALALIGAMFITVGPRHVGAQEAPAVQQAGVQLTFPWDGGDSWRYLWGPHTGNSGVLAALDLQSPDAVGKPCGYISNSWVVAAADGRVTAMQNAIEIDHGNGFRTGYFHLGDKQVTSGYVRAGDRLGRPDCCPDGGEPFACYSTTPHLHFYTMYNGAKQDIRGINFQGWTLGTDNCFQKGAERKCEGSSLLSTAPPPNDAVPSARADVALVIDGSDAAREAAHVVLGALANGDRAAVFGYGSSTKQFTELTTLGAPQKDAIDDAVPGAGDPAHGIAAACALLAADPGAQARAVVAIGGGWHAGEALTGAMPCFAAGGPKLFVYNTSGALPEGVSTELAKAATVGLVGLAGVRDQPCEFQRLRSAISEDGLGACTSFVLRTGQVVAMPFAVPPGLTGATFSVRWNAPAAGAELLDIRPVLLNNARQRVSPDSGRAMIIAGANHETYSVPAPAEGRWKLYVTADGIPEAGITVRLTSTSAAPSLAGFSTPTATSSPEPTGSSEPTEEPTPGEAPEETPTATPHKSQTSPKATPTPDKPSPTPAKTPVSTPAPTDTPGPLPTPGKPEPPPA